MTAAELLTAERSLTARVLTVRDVARAAALSEYTIRKMARLGQIPARKIGGDWRFSREKVERFLGVKL